MVSMYSPEIADYVFKQEEVYDPSPFVIEQEPFTKGYLVKLGNLYIENIHAQFCDNKITFTNKSYSYYPQTSYDIALNIRLVGEGWKAHCIFYNKYDAEQMVKVLKTALYGIN